MNQPTSFEDFTILENEPAKKKTTLASPFLPKEKRKLSSEDIFKENFAKKKNKKPSNLKTFIGNNHVTEMKI